MSLFDRKQFMLKSNKALLGSHIKSMNTAVTATELTEIKTTLIQFKKARFMGNSNNKSQLIDLL